jgi:hypothetical protein
LALVAVFSHGSPTADLRHNGRTPFQTKWPATAATRAGRWPVQLRYACPLTGAEYVNQAGWQAATLSRCPLHPHGGCHFARHGTYTRVSPPGTRVARWYCREGHCTFSLLPDCLAARLSGTLAEVEALVRAAEQAPSREALCARERLEIELPGALRWVRRRVQAVHEALHLVKGLLGVAFVLVAPTLTAFGAHLGAAEVLVALRGIATPWLAVLPAPLGFAPRRRARASVGKGRQQQAGPDPPRP